jgi:UDP-GlcNAc:undecaprenyl-phosphate GlcNAc-1-phosphate transferase
MSMQGIHQAGAWLGVSFAFAVAAIALLVYGPGLGRVATALPGGRRLQESPIPLVGGWVLGPIWIAACALGFRGEGALSLAVGCTLVWAVGVLDDIRGVRPRFKLIAEAIAAIVVIAGGPALDSVGAPGLGVGTVSLGAWTYPLVFGWIVAVTNAFNLIDGLDGLLGTMAVIALGGLALHGVEAAATLALVGGVLGVLAFNLPRARAYFGDSGSLLLGFIVAVLCTRLPPDRNVPLALGLLSVPLLDLLLTLVRRWMRGVPLSAADRGHLHHRIIDLCAGGPWRALAVLALFALTPMALSLWRPGLASLTATLALGGLATLAVVRLNSERLRGALRGRGRWQRLYLVEGYVVGLVRLARTPEDVVRALTRLVEDLPLARVRLGSIRLGSAPLEEPVVLHEVPIARGATAAWAASDEALVPTSLAIARSSVICDLLRTAARRLEELGASVAAGTPVGPIDALAHAPLPAASRRP